MATELTEDEKVWIKSEKIRRTLVDEITSLQKQAEIDLTSKRLIITTTQEEIVTIREKLATDVKVKQDAIDAL